ncbi:hypothetical protein BASA81_008532 [Batrachochytrium salamandrivorans]|nr:hypothetical protein BASA81_008532 [Batrachochytrium salamandrivorans]
MLQRRVLSTLTKPAAGLIKVELQGTALSPAITADQLETLVLSSPSKSFTPANCSETIYLLGAKRSGNKFALDRALALSKDMEFSPAHLSQVFVGLATNRSVTKLPEFLVHHPTLTLGLSLFSVLDLKSVVHSLARLDQREQHVLDAIAKEISSRPLLLEAFSGKDLSAVLYSYAKLKMRDSQSANEMVSKMYDELRLRKEWTKFRATDYADLLVAFAYFGKTDGVLLSKWETELIRAKPTKWCGSDFTKIIASMPQLPFANPSNFLNSYLFDAMLGRGHFSFNGHDVQKMTQALSLLQVPPPQVFLDRLCILLQDNPSEFRIPHLSYIATALRQLDGACDSAQAIQMLEAQHTTRSAANKLLHHKALQ